MGRATGRNACPILPLPDPDKRGGLNASTQHSAEVLFAWFQGLNLFASVDSKKRLPCLGLIEYSPKGDCGTLRQRNESRSRRATQPFVPSLLALDECCLRPGNGRHENVIVVLTNCGKT